MMALNTILNIDCREGLQNLPENMVDACVTDPPYGIKFMGRGWDYQIPAVEVWSSVRRVLKPGAHMLVACGTRTQHRMVVNVEDAGFEIRDVITWHYGQGFPKSVDIGKAVGKRGDIGGPEQAKGWEGWGTALKPATEFWTLARKPYDEHTIADNMIKYGVGALNIDACRIHSSDATGGSYSVKRLKAGATLTRTGGNWRPADKDARLYWGVMKAGRFPANLVLDEFAAEAMDKQSGVLTSGKPSGVRKAMNHVFGAYSPGLEVTGYGDSGGASRFFYVAKADAEERGYKNTHPTVKPLALMQYLIRLICPIESGRLVLDPFAGSGSTCLAAAQLGLNFIGFEKDAGYAGIAEDRLRKALGLFFEDRRAGL